MDGILNKEMVVCCFCGKSLPLEAAVVLKVWANEKSEEYQVYIPINLILLEH